MKKFLCICLSPAIDGTVRLPAWPTDGCILKDALSSVVGGLIDRLTAFKSALDAEDAPRLHELLDRGRAVIESMPPTYKSFARR